MYNILIEFGIPMKLVRLIKMNETYRRVWVGKHLSDMFPIKNGLKYVRRYFITTAFELCFTNANSRVQVSQYGLKLNGTHRLVVYADDVNILGGSIHTINKNKEAPVGDLISSKG